MSSHLATALKQMNDQGTVEEFLSRVRSEAIRLLEEHGQPLPDNVAIGLNEAGDDIKIYSDEEVNPVLEIVVKQVAEKEIAAFTGQTVGPVPGPLPPAKSSKYATIAFYALNGLLFFGSITWVFTVLNSSDFRQWYYSELLNVSSVFASLSFSILIPTVLLASVLVFFLRRHSTEKPITVTEVLWKFEVPVLIILFIAREVTMAIPLTDGLRVFMSILTWIVVVDAFVHRFKLVPRSFLPIVAAYTGSIVSLSIIGYWTLAVLLPLAGTVITEMEFDIIGEIFDALLYEPTVIFLLAFYLLLASLPYVFTFIVGKRVLKRLWTYKDIINAPWPHLSTTLQAAVPIVLLLLMFVLSRAPGIGEYAEPLILAAQSVNTYGVLQSRAIPLVDEKEAIEKALRNEVNKYDQYLLRSGEFEDSFSHQYLKLVWFPFVDSDTYESRQSSNRSTLLQGYKRVFGEPYTERRDTLTELRQVQLRSRDVLANTLDSENVAQVTVTDAYTTFVTRDQEVVLEFALPEHAVITDLKLGSALQFQGQIAPRGAAEQVYTEQVWRNIDPALLEQVGPRQYRLRVYPVPASTNIAEQRRREEVEGDTQRVQFSYTVFRDTEGIPLPIYSQQYNLLTSETEYTYSLNGQPVAVDSNRSHIVEPKTLSSLCSDDTEVSAPGLYNSVYTFNIGTESSAGDCVGLSATDIDLVGQRIVFYLDTSFDTNSADVAAVLNDMRALPEQFYEQNNVSLIYFNDLESAPMAINATADIPNVEDIVFFGGTKLWNFVKTTDSDISIFLSGDVPTDTSTRYHQEPIDVTSRIALIHYGTDIPVYRNSILSQFRSPSFKVYDDVEDALKTLSLLTASSSEQLLAIGDYWNISNRPVGTTSTTSMSLNLRTQEGQDLRTIALRAELVMLDEAEAVSQQSLHETAKTNGIVTPLSSYIALVNNQQQERLDELSAQEDRFTSENRFRFAQPQVGNPFSSNVGGMMMMGGATGLSSPRSADMSGVAVPGGGSNAGPSIPSPSVQSTESNDSGFPKLPLIIFFGTVGLVIAGTVYVVLRRVRSTD